MKLRPSPVFTKYNRDAIRRGDKTQTRQVVKPQPKGISNIWVPGLSDGDLYWDMTRDALCRAVWSRRKGESLTSVLLRPPYGQPGDMWYLREPLVELNGMTMYGDNGVVDCRDWAWKSRCLSSMSMPRRFARTFRVITDVRPERLQDISPADCLAEGVVPWRDRGASCFNFMGFTRKTVREAFFAGWDHINARHPRNWALYNPYNWVYTFREATPAEIEAVKEK